MAIPARNLTGPGAVYQSYAGVWIQPNKKDKQRTSKLKNLKGGNVCYAFETQFICPQGAPDAIRIKCYDYAMTRGNFSLGHAVVNLKAMPTVFQNSGTVVDMWIPLIDSKAKVPSPSGQPEARIQVAWAPILIPPGGKLSPFISGNSLPPIRILLEKQSYVAGELMRGLVIFNNARQEKIKSITLNVEVQESVTHHEWRPVIGHWYYYSWKYHLDESSLLYGTTEQGKSLLMEPGCYGWVFEFVLPNNLPPSYRCRNNNGQQVRVGDLYAPWGRVYHRLTASVNNSELAIPPYFLNFDMKVFMAEPGRTVGGSIESEGINITISGPEVIFQGETATLSINVTNNGQKPIKEIRASLFAIQTHRSSLTSQVDQTRMKFLSVTHSGPQQGFPLLPGKSWGINDAFQIPANMQLTVALNCAALARFYHYFVVEAVPEGFLSKEVSAQYVVVVASRGGHYNVPDPARGLEPGRFYTAAYPPNSIAFPTKSLMSLNNFNILNRIDRPPMPIIGFANPDITDRSMVFSHLPIGPLPLNGVVLSKALPNTLHKPQANAGDSLPADAIGPPVVSGFGPTPSAPMPVVGAAQVAAVPPPGQTPGQPMPGQPMQQPPMQGQPMQYQPPPGQPQPWSQQPIPGPAGQPQQAANKRSSQMAPF